MICGPRAQSSPSSPGPSSSPVATSTTLSSVFGTTSPDEPGRIRAGSSHGFSASTELVSVMPQPWPTVQPIHLDQAPVVAEVLDLGQGARHHTPPAGAQSGVGQLRDQRVAEQRFHLSLVLHLHLRSGNGAPSARYVLRRRVGD